MVCKQTSGEISQMKDIFFTLIVCKQTGGKILHMKNIFFCNSNMHINKWLNFTDEGQLFYINGMQTNKWWIFTDEGYLLYVIGTEIFGHIFYIQLPCYANNQVSYF